MASSAWLRDHGWLMGYSAADKKATHLLLEGGKAHVPAEASGAFLNAYALAVVRGVQPSVVELRTPIFRLFMDLDIKVDSRGKMCFFSVVEIIQNKVAEFFDASDGPRLIVCDTTPSTLSDGGTKAGRHLVWPSIYVKTHTALALRTLIVDELETTMSGACTKPWDAVVDKCVFVSNGLRMPWSVKGRGNMAIYTPTSLWIGASESCAIDPPSGVSSIREWVKDLSIRVFGVEETPLREGVEVPMMLGDSVCVGSVGGTTRRLAEFADVTQDLIACLPPEFSEARVTGIMQTETCFLLRSSSQYCINRGTRHNSCGTFYVLTLRGVRQKCFCTCETTENRQWGLCRDFASEYFSVPVSILKRFFGDDADVPGTFKAAVLPSAQKRVGSAKGLSDLLAKCRPMLKAKPPTTKRRK